jgi:hypothetical protein
MVLSKDNRKTYNDCLRSIFEDFHLLRTEGVPELGWMPFEVPDPQDMKSFQLCLNRVGACKGTNYLCDMCQLHSDNVQRPEQLPCENCVMVSPPENCYCHPMHDAEYCSFAQTRLTEMHENPDAKHLASICRCIKAKWGNTQWEMLYDKCSMPHILDAAGIPTGYSEDPEHFGRWAKVCTGGV